MKQQRLSNRFRRSFLSFVYSLSRAFLVLVLLNAPAAMAGADLAIGLDASPNPAGVGDSIEVTIQVENKGPDPAAFVALGAGIPSQASFVSVTSPYSLLPARSVRVW